MASAPPLIVRWRALLDNREPLVLAHMLSVAAFFAVTLGVQATNHFVINTAHYARQPGIAEEPVLWGGLAAVIIQGSVVTFLYSRVSQRFSGIRGGLAFSLLMGAFLGSYIALGEAQPGRLATGGIRHCRAYESQVADRES
ncbi:MAG: hypothetical protein HY056_10780 [Proteobacteria bacterium]|nr:hypothetical protein [Pseudomonadota bacterium]